MRKIYKRGNDFVFAIQMLTSDADNGNLLLSRVRKFREVNIKIYTNDIDEFVTASYNSAGSGTWTNIVEQEHYDFVIINRSDLEKLEDGILKIQIDFQLGALDFKDKTYMETYNIETEYYLFDKLYNSSDCPSCKLINN